MKKIILAISILSLTGCTQIVQHMQNSRCNPDTAFARGVNDAKKNKDMNTDYASICPIAIKAEVNDAYRRGYLAALRSKSY